MSCAVSALHQQRTLFWRIVEQTMEGTILPGQSVPAEPCVTSGQPVISRKFLIDPKEVRLVVPYIRSGPRPVLPRDRKQSRSIRLRPEVKQRFRYLVSYSRAFGVRRYASSCRDLNRLTVAFKTGEPKRLIASYESACCAAKLIALQGVLGQARALQKERSCIERIISGVVEERSMISIAATLRNHPYLCAATSPSIRPGNTCFYAELLHRIGEPEQIERTADVRIIVADPIEGIV